MTEVRRQVTLADGRTVSAVQVTPGSPPPPWVVVYAPGAGSSLEDEFGVYLCERLAAEGLAAARFQFPYQEAHKGRPDPPAVLDATWRAAIEAFRPLGQRIAIGGRSMGGRVASLVAAKGTAVDALALFAYPLHPPGQPEKRRDAHLPQIAAPTLFCCGTRDVFGAPEELATAAALAPKARLHLLEGADHGFDVLKSSGRTRRDVWAEAVNTLLAWLPA